jgi:hypothetical protein
LCSAEQDSQTREEQVLSISSKNTSLKMKAKKVSGEEHVDDVNDTLETDELNKDKTRLKVQSEPESTIAKATTKKKRMVKSDEVSGCVLNSRLCRIIYFLL